MLDELMEALKATGIPFAQDAWDTAPKSNYGVASLAGMTPLWADGELVEAMERFDVDLFTLDDGDEDANKVMAALNDLGYAWALASRVYEMQMGLTHYRWTVTEAI